MEEIALKNQHLIQELVASDFVACDPPMGTIDCPNVDRFLGEISNVSINLSNNYQSYYYHPSIHICNNIDKGEKSSKETILQDVIEVLNDNDFHPFPLLKSCGSIYIPKKIEKLIYNFFSVKDLKEIDSDITSAKEYIYIVLSKLMYNDEYRELSTKYLSSLLFGIDSYNVKVKKILELLIKGTVLKGGIIECDYIYIKDVKSRGYRLTETYRNRGYKKYYFKSEKVLNQYKIMYLSKLEEIKNNTIASNLLKMYEGIELPTQEEILNESKRLIKEGFKTKKGKLLKIRGHKPKEQDNTELYSYTEDSIDTFTYLTEDGFILPVLGGEWSGGRVVDSFSLMPSWIRNLCKINGQQIVESDYSALHPNLAIKLFKGDTEYLTHKKVSEALKINLTTVKINHLSFFNQQVWQMETNPVYQYYSIYEPYMLESIIRDKQKNGYKNITKQLFGMEVRIMSAVIKKLNEHYIYVGYIYDALFCDPTDCEIVKNTMNETIKEFGVLTIAK